MSKLRESKPLAICAMVLVVVVLVLTAFMNPEWWEYIPIFFAFMMAFFHLMAVFMLRIPNMSRLLDLWAFVFAILMVVGIIGVYIVESVQYGL